MIFGVIQVQRESGGVVVRSAEMFLGFCADVWRHGIVSNPFCILALRMKGE